MLQAGLPVGAGTDATRVASCNPWVSLSWRATGKTLGSLKLYPQSNLLDREAALRLWTEANIWFSTEQSKKGQIKAGQLADLIVLDRRPGQSYASPWDPALMIELTRPLSDPDAMLALEPEELGAKH